MKYILLFTAFFLTASPLLAQTVSYNGVIYTTPIYTPTVYTPTVYTASIPVSTSSSMVSTMGYGSSGPHVLHLQQLLQRLGYFPAYLVPTGYYGTTTMRAVQQFQYANGIPATGYVGSRTQAALASYSGGYGGGYPSYPQYQSYTQCMPPDVSLSDVLANEMVHMSDTMSERGITVREKLDAIRARCSGGRLVDQNGSRIYFYRMTGCWGNAPADYLDTLSTQDREIAVLRAQYTVLLLSCNQSGYPLY
jgi:hypothetical protein